VPADIPLFDGYRVVVLGPASCARSFIPQGDFGGLRADIEVERVLSSNEVTPGSSVSRCPNEMLAQDHSVIQEQKTGPSPANGAIPWRTDKKTARKRVPERTAACGAAGLRTGAAEETRTSDLFTSRGARSTHAVCR